MRRERKKETSLHSPHEGKTLPSISDKFVILIDFENLLRDRRSARTRGYFYPYFALFVNVFFFNPVHLFCRFFIFYYNLSFNYCLFFLSLSIFLCSLIFLSLFFHHCLFFITIFLSLSIVFITIFLSLLLTTYLSISIFYDLFIAIYCFYHYIPITISLSIIFFLSISIYRFITVYLFINIYLLITVYLFITIYPCSQLPSIHPCFARHVYTVAKRNRVCKLEYCNRIKIGLEATERRRICKIRPKRPKRSN